MGINIDIIRKKCKLIVDLWDLSVFFINPEGIVVFEEVNQKPLNPFLDNDKANFFNHLNYQFSQVFEFPIIKKTVFLDKYIIISVMNNNVFQGTVIIGSTLSFQLSEDKINSIINDARAFFYREKVFNYYKSLPIIDSEKLTSISIFVSHLLNNNLLSPESVLHENAVKSNTNKIIEKVYSSTSENLIAKTLHHDRLFEKKMLQMVREGRLDDLKKISSLRKDEEVVSMLSKSSYIRSIKNHIITLITLVSRAAIEGGLNDKVAISLHDSFILQLEELKHLDEIKGFSRNVLYTFTKNVKQGKDEPYSNTIIACKDYIYKHIYEKINHNDIAKKVELSPKYLSILFKKETGISVSEYIQKSKIDEAKKMLTYSNTSISEIATLLHFYDQSYFTTVFKKRVGITPKQYREKHHLLNN
ncbi:helix-turn-helix domain-containing protein [Metabacillus halosaccharovorans]|uniref:helix-turn-helix domain-containing protein n=1 Tax=Metabacillus halosaccharovorans TaxID=930124 RepID=UPI001C1F2725|nr:helix-turn-helix domain-containing protein [Metabacillus halosaccharovorans]MBU7595772.1 helix-turn-helix domain-containing protein [Metabacillus halosaccharovorans]